MWESDILNSFLPRSSWQCNGSYWDCLWRKGHCRHHQPAILQLPGTATNDTKVLDMWLKCHMSPDTIQSSCHLTHSLIYRRSHLGAGFLDIQFPRLLFTCWTRTLWGYWGQECNVSKQTECTILYILVIQLQWFGNYPFGSWLVWSSRHLTYRWLLKHSEEMKLVNKEQMLAMWLPRWCCTAPDSLSAQVASHWCL